MISAVVSFGQEFFRTHQVRQATFDAASSPYSVFREDRGLANLMGY